MNQCHIARHLRTHTHSQAAQEAADHTEPEDANVRRMNTSIKLNRIIREHSKNAQLVMMSCPGVPSDDVTGYRYLEFIEVGRMSVSSIRSLFLTGAD